MATEEAFVYAIVTNAERMWNESSRCNRLVQAPGLHQLADMRGAPRDVLAFRSRFFVLGGSR